MAVADLLHTLFEATVATSGAVVLVLLLRRALRSLFGAVVAYSAWLVVPLAAVAMVLPAAPAPIATSHAIHSFAVVSVATDAVAKQGGGHWSAWLLAAWSMGLAIAVIGLARQQHAFLRGLGTLRPRPDGLKVADAMAGLPAAIGWWRPMVVLPSDFETRYDVLQRELLVAHERSHIAHGDLQANALVAVMRCIFWFNPMIHLATRHFRHDQELACDARIVARHPGARRAYGEAMLQTQLATQALPLSCHWSYGHPLKERIAMLNQPHPSFVRWLVGSAMVGALTLGCGFAAWANQTTPAAADRKVSVRIDNVSFLVAAQEIARSAGVRLANPEVLQSKQRFTFHLVDEPLDDVLSLLGKEVGLVPQVTDRDVRFVAATRSPEPATPPAPPTPPLPANAPPPPTPPAGLAHLNPTAMPPAPKAPPRPPLPPKDVPDPRMPPPPYPPQALRQGVDGTVVLLIDVGADGKPTHVQVEHSQPAGVFDAAAVEAAKRWTFDPKRTNGQAVASRVQVPVRFEARTAGAAQ